MRRMFKSFSRHYQAIKIRRFAFLAVFFVVILLTYGFLYAIDFIPQAPAKSAATATSTVAKMAALAPTTPVSTAAPALDPYPHKIIFDSLHKTLTVSNPTSTNIEVMDKALLSGPIRDPRSADFVHTGNILILGHSSYLPNVINKNYQAFNGIQNLNWGDTIRLQSSDTEYVYRVDRVYKAKAADVVVPQTPGIAELTLDTCNVLAAKEDRYIVDAVLISSHPLASIGR